MNAILTRLRQDNDNLHHLLDVLDRQLRALQRGHAPDYQLMRDILHYLSQMPSRCRHRCEDRVRERLLRRQPELTGPLQQLSALREHLTDRSRECLTLTEAVLDEATVSRQALYTLGHDYVGAYRSHLRHIEHVLCRPAADALRAADWLLLETELHWREDRLSGEQVEAHYQSLRDRIAVEMASCHRDEAGLELCDACAAA